MPARLPWFIRVASFCCLLSAPWLARAAPLGTPRSGARLEAFAPAGWAIERKLEGDLDGDGKPDAVLVLLQKETEEGGVRDRALVILLRRGAAWEVGGTNRGLVYGWQMAGVKGGDGAPMLEIKKGVLSVSQYGGSRWAYGSVHRFRWSHERARLELIGLDTDKHDAVTGEASERSCNLLTGLCLETRTPPQVDAEGDELEAPPTTTRSDTGKRPLLPLEAVTLEPG